MNFIFIFIIKQKCNFLDPCARWKADKDNNTHTYTQTFLCNIKLNFFINDYVFRTMPPYMVKRKRKNEATLEI
jgi:hypothetical protein